MTMNAAPLEAVSIASIGENNMRCIFYLSFLMAIHLPSILEDLTPTRIISKQNKLD
jgi:hypothetical protein